MLNKLNVLFCFGFYRSSVAEASNDKFSTSSVSNVHEIMAQQRVGAMVVSLSVIERALTQRVSEDAAMAAGLRL